MVWQARDRKSGDLVALKQIKFRQELTAQEGFPPTALREVNILLSLRHPHVVNVREMVVGDTYDKIFMVRHPDPPRPSRSPEGICNKIVITRRARAEQSRASLLLGSPLAFQQPLHPSFQQPLRPAFRLH